MRLAVVILNYNTCDLLRRCLHSVFAAADWSVARLTMDVLVVDSASRDGSAAMVAAEFPQAHLLASPHNLGYTGGNNLALATLGFPVESASYPLTLSPNHPIPDFVLLLNADTEVAEDALWEMVHALVKQPAAGACGPRLRFGDGHFQHGAFRFPSLVQLALDLFPISALPGGGRLWNWLYNSPLNGRYELARWQAEEPFPVDFVLGAALLMRGEAVRAIGGLDEGYFLYCEEIDWCLRAHQAGWQVLAVPTARVIHHEGQSSRQVRWPAYERLWRSRLRFFEKHARHYPPGYLGLVRATIRLGLHMRAWLAERCFAQGAITGVELQRELESYQTIVHL
jgi:N-acetylglucosaminyl-diphospho-decaprenol L-rhamnosyltransferase